MIYLRELREYTHARIYDDNPYVVLTGTARVYI